MNAEAAPAAQALLAAVGAGERTSADEALVYVDDTMPGWRRERRGEEFVYRDASGRMIRDEEALRRIRSLAIPPAYEDVWICPLPEGHLQATA